MCIDADGTSLAAFSYRARAPVCPVCPVCPSLTIPLQMIDHGRMLQMGMCLPIDGTSTNWNSSKIAIHPPKTIKGNLNPPAYLHMKEDTQICLSQYTYYDSHTHTTLQQMIFCDHSQLITLHTLYETVLSSYLSISLSICQSSKK